MEEEDQKKLSEPRTPTGVGWKWDVVFLEFVILNYRVRPGNMCMNPVDARSVQDNGTAGTASLPSGSFPVLVRKQKSRSGYTGIDQHCSRQPAHWARFPTRDDSILHIA